MADLKTRLRHLDRLDAPDIWERATSIQPPRTPDVEAPSRATRRRVVAGVVAAVVFIAAGAFAQQAFRETSRGPFGFVPSSIDGYVLWPERTGADLKATQALADADDPDVAWRLDPKEVATRFAEQVLAWGTPAGRYAVDVHTVPTDGPVSSLTVTLDRITPPCPSPPPGSDSFCPPPFQGERLQLEQMGTVGDRGVWSVTEVRASGIHLELAAGDSLPDGSSIPSTITFPSQFSSPDATPRVFGTAGVTIGTSQDCFAESTNEYADDNFSLDVSIPSGSTNDCGIAPASYAWAAIEPAPGVVGYGPDPDPLYASTKDADAGNTPFTVFALTAVPMLVSNRPRETSSPMSTHQTTSSTSTATSTTGTPTTSSSLIEHGTIRCTATFPSDTIRPGEETDVRFVETNVSDGTVTARDGVNGDNGWLLVSSGGSQVADSSLAHEGIIGPAPLLTKLAPGESAKVFAWQTNIIWPGPLEVTPVCLGEPLPPITLQVAATTAPQSAEAAVSSALAEAGDWFGTCKPSTDGWTTGRIVFPGPMEPFDVRCGAWVGEQPGFDVVVLAVVAPPDAPDAVPYFDIHPPSPFSISWWVVVVTSDNAMVTHQYGVRQCQGSSQYGSHVVTPCGTTPSP
jgi:hypothetical protein